MSYQPNYSVNYVVLCLVHQKHQQAVSRLTLSILACSVVAVFEIYVAIHAGATFLSIV